MHAPDEIPNKRRRRATIEEDRVTGSAVESYNHAIDSPCDADQVLCNGLEQIIYIHTLTKRYLSQLGATSGYLECLLQKKSLRYHAIAKSIAECRSQINEYLQECMVSTVGL